MTIFAINQDGKIEIEKDYALKVKIKDIVAADKLQLDDWEKQLKEYVNEVMGEDNVAHSGNAVSKARNLYG